MSEPTSVPARVSTNRRPAGYWRSGDGWVFLTSGATAIALMLILFVFFLIVRGGLGFFWPSELEELTLNDGQVVLGQHWEREPVPPGQAAYDGEQRVLIHAGNRRLYGDREFVWVDESTIADRATPASATLIERQEYGPFIGYISGYERGGEIVAEGDDAYEMVEARLGSLHKLRKRVQRLERREVGAINAKIETTRRRLRSLERDGAAGGEEAAGLNSRLQELQAEYQQIESEIHALQDSLRSDVVHLTTADHRETSVAAGDIVRFFQPNALGPLQKAGVYGSRFWEFVSGQPREANTEGGVLPAIFGTVLLVFLMTLAVVPLGVVTALYLREYARQGTLVRIVRIAVNNLAGIPSIVFGIFGLGFFIYTVGGSIDRMFFSDALPAPTYGTGGILWSALTLALLTLPVVIVATEEGLAAVPTAVREGSLALGATKWETTWKVVLPAASPGILTGVILAIARAAGEVAPLMLTGAVKIAAELPLDNIAPFLHLERKFMHLGFHIYDVGFQSPNVEAAKPMVYMTTFLLVAIVFLLNLIAMWIRNRLRARYASSAF